MGCTSLSEDEAQALISRLSSDWQGNEYDVLRCNCCHFSDQLCREIGVGGVPKWVINLAGGGAVLEDHLRTVESVAQASVAKAGEARSVLTRGGNCDVAEQANSIPPVQSGFARGARGTTIASCRLSKSNANATIAGLASFARNARDNVLECSKSARAVAGFGSWRYNQCH